MFTQGTVRTMLGLFALALSTGTARAYCRATTAAPDSTVVDPNVDAEGCPADGIPLYWKSECLGVHIDEAASQYVSLSATRRLLTDAFAEWKAANGLCVPSIDVIQLDPVSSPAIGPASDPGENDLLYRDIPVLDGPISMWDRVVTNVDQETGELRDTDIAINGKVLSEHLDAPDGGAADPATLPFLRTLFVHIAGHFLGFAHSQDPSSVMYALGSPSDTGGRRLSDDDAAGMCAVYPENGDRPTLDAQGNSTTVPSSACNLAVTTATSPCSGGAIKLDHGCSVAVGRRTARASDALLVASALGVCVAWLRRRRNSRAVKKSK